MKELSGIMGDRMVCVSDLASDHSYFSRGVTKKSARANGSCSGVKTRPTVKDSSTWSSPYETTAAKSTCLDDLGPNEKAAGVRGVRGE